MKIVAVWNRKGGAGKTTLSVHLAHWLALRGRGVTFIDSDSQGNGFRWMTKYAEALEANTMSVVGMFDKDGNEVYKLLAHYLPGLRRAMDCFRELEQLPKGFRRPRHVFVVDCPPSTEPAAWIEAANLVVVPMIGRLSAEGGEEVVTRLGARCVIVPNMVRPGAWSGDDVDNMRRFGVEVLAPIPSGDAVRRSEQIGVPVWRVPYGEGSAVAEALMEFGEDIHGRV
jgi:cellulose biosynthesis protein BcsQ